MAYLPGFEGLDLPDVYWPVEFGPKKEPEDERYLVGYMVQGGSIVIKTRCRLENVIAELDKVQGNEAVFFALDSKLGILTALFWAEWIQKESCFQQEQERFAQWLSSQTKRNTIPSISVAPEVKDLSDPLARAVYDGFISNRRST